MVSESEYARRAGVVLDDNDHCISCHEDANHGYAPMIERDGDLDGDPLLEPNEMTTLCCYVFNKIEAERAARGGTQ